MQEKESLVRTDFSVNTCSTCGGYPVQVDWIFDLPKTMWKKRKVGGRLITMKRERRTYYHCPCGERVTRWYRPQYDEKMNIVHPAVFFARNAWIKGRFIKSDGCNIKNKMV